MARPRTSRSRPTAPPPGNAASGTAPPRAKRATGKGAALACCTDPKCGRTRPNPIRGQAVRTEIGRPNGVVRLMGGGRNQGM